MYLLIQKNTDERIKQFLSDYFNLIFVPECEMLPQPVRGHVDMSLFVFSDRTAVARPELYDFYSRVMTPLGYSVIRGKTYGLFLYTV